MFWYLVWISSEVAEPASLRKENDRRAEYQYHFTGWATKHPATSRDYHAQTVDASLKIYRVEHVVIMLALCRLQAEWRSTFPEGKIIRYSEIGEIGVSSESMSGRWR